MSMKMQTLLFALAICMKLASDFQRQGLIMQSETGAAVYMYSLSEAELKRCSLAMGFVKAQKRTQNVM